MVRGTKIGVRPYLAFAKPRYPPDVKYSLLDGEIMFRQHPADHQSSDYQSNIKFENTTVGGVEEGIDK